MPPSRQSWHLALLFALLSTLPADVYAAGKSSLPPPAKKDICAGSLGGEIPYNHNRYKWFCSGKQSARPGKTTSFSLQCAPGHFDKRKRYAYWVSSPALKLIKVSWDPSFAELNATFSNTSRKQQTFEYWESCLNT